MRAIALVGPSGGGKTTVAGLISRFWDVGGGAIQIGGVNVKDIPKETLMDTVAYVFQDSRLLKASILENVRLRVMAEAVKWGVRAHGSTRLLPASSSRHWRWMSLTALAGISIKICLPNALPVALGQWTKLQT